MLNHKLVTKQTGADGVLVQKVSAPRKTEIRVIRDVALVP